jgi:hypothetical protein
MSSSLLTRLFGGRIDERFLNHRLRSTSLAGIISGIAAILLFWFHLYFHHVWRWDLLSIALIFVIIKMSVMLYYVLTD